MGELIQLCAARNPEPAAEVSVDCDVPEEQAERAARRTWFQDRWRAFHLVIPGRDHDWLRIHLHHQFRRRRR